MLCECLRKVSSLPRFSQTLSSPSAASHVSLLFQRGRISPVRTGIERDINKARGRQQIEEERPSHSNVGGRDRARAVRKEGRCGGGLFMPRKSCATSWQHFRNEPQKLGEQSRHIETRMVAALHKTQLFTGWLGGTSPQVFHYGVVHLSFLLSLRFSPSPVLPHCFGSFYLSPAAA